ncbi:MAG: GIY-YIG nuclease family protein [bacterium]|nr:GIY-YIG nuclease family protein [bacterium]
MYFVYILLCADGSLYTGITNDIDRRFLQHKNKKGGKYTASHPVKKVVYSEEFKSRGDALKREFEIKTLRKANKLKLIKGLIVTR